MNKERELLERIYSYLNSGYWVIDEFETQIDDIVKEIEELLAQPEHIVDVTDMVEPVAWLHEWVDEIGEHVKSVVYNFYDDANLIPLYTAPQKRKHLTGIEISQGFQTDDDATHPYSYWSGVDFAEKAHGIGVDDE